LQKPTLACPPKTAEKHRDRDTSQATSAPLVRMRPIAGAENSQALASRRSQSEFNQLEKTP
jgi:hypothetical protein